MPKWKIIVDYLVFKDSLIILLYFSSGGRR